MTKLCERGKRAAKKKFKVYPSAYANAYASKICAGKAKDDRGVRRKDFKGPKPSGGGGTGAAAKRIRKASSGGDIKIKRIDPFNVFCIWSWNNEIDGEGDVDKYFESEKKAFEWADSKGIVNVEYDLD